MIILYSRTMSWSAGKGVLFAYCFCLLQTVSYFPVDFIPMNFHIHPSIHPSTYIFKAFVLLLHDLEEFHGKDQGSTSGNGSSSSCIYSMMQHREYVNITFPISKSKSTSHQSEYPCPNNNPNNNNNHHSQKREKHHYFDDVPRSPYPNSEGMYSSHLAPSFISCIASVQPLMTWFGDNDSGCPRL